MCNKTGIENMKFCTPLFVYLNSEYYFFFDVRHYFIFQPAFRGYQNFEYNAELCG